MPYVIGAACIDSRDQSCVEVCPVDCIHDLGVMFVIDPDTCIDCGACLPECPVDAISDDRALPAEWQPYADASAAFALGKDEVRRLLDELHAS
jgi:ferredoxin